MSETKEGVPEKCPCCNNPWSAGTSDMFAQLCAMCEKDDKKKGTREEKEEDTGLSRSNMDESIDPADNFFLYANGSWIKNNPIPPGYPSWNTFLHLHVLSQERLKDLLSELEEFKTSGGGADPALPEDELKVATFYAAAMDETTIEKDGVGPLISALDLCDETANVVEKMRASDDDGHDNAATLEEEKRKKSELAVCIGRFKAEFGIEMFFGIGASPDHKNSDHSICQVGQGGLGLPDRDYYFDQDKAEKRDAYKRHVAMMLTLLTDPDASEPSAECASAAEDVYALELKLAEAHMTKTECRDPHAVYNKMTVSDLTSRCGGGVGGTDANAAATTTTSPRFDFESYFVAATGGRKSSADELGHINVRNVAAIERAAEILSTVASPDVLRNYLRWHVVHSCASYMSRAFVMENFDFNERILAGTAEIKPRWKRAMAFTESALGEALGKLYCARYFDESCKDRALAIVEHVRCALEERLKEVDWMTSDETRASAMNKMGRFKVKIGYPDEWIDYSDLKIGEGDSFLSMVFKARAFDLGRDVKDMNAPTDRKKWFLTPQTVNAYYHPNLNEIVFPAAILQPPFFNQNADDAVNYGAMGAVVGHEMTHAFDDKGRKFNHEGNMIDWWKKSDADEYERRVEVMIEQANSFRVYGQSVQGKLTCGENIADLGGLRLALRALRSRPDFDPTKVVDGFGPLQRFFLSWAQAWRQNITKDRALQLLTLDPHGPNEMRCNGPLSNMPEFHEAFGIKEGSAMFKPVESRVDIW